jgi:ribosomal protein S18 acetylase RimI-like enzyme
LCSVCGKHVCSSHSKIQVICNSHRKAVNATKIEVREATKKDHDVIGNIEDSILEHEEYEGSDEYWEKLWEGIEKNTLVAIVEGKVVGFLEYCKTVDPHERVSFSTVDFTVNPCFQGLGVGKALFENVIKIARKEGIEKVYASTAANNLPTILFHLKNGAEIHGVESIGTPVERWGIKTDKSVSFVYSV